MTETLASLRPRDDDAMRGELRLVARDSAAPVVFGGAVLAGDVLMLSEFLGTRTRGLHGLLIPPASGLGGRVVALRQPAGVADYPNAPSISHDYDRVVVGEGIRSVVAVPVVVGGQARAVLYAAGRSQPVGDRVTDVLARSASRLATELAIRDEVDRRMKMARAAAVATGAADSARAEGIRGVHAELRGIASAVTDPVLRRTLSALSERLAAVISGEDAPMTDVTLSPRELDVLAHVALGCSNAEAAERLSLRMDTVKGYLRSAMRKLDATSRHEAVVNARRMRLLP
ncbi:LuxR C-terminal-related transcriptional regulator [Nocardia sp. XZ_19_385]|uniref:helix-turn-helix transcriptional regulator n=1 Tax=Nocardia sp. XZ_19_385 TaxID=2769488 RepID=UPI0018907EE8|nr:LuxR C-terminal-related transcriptional regulator [Nocardia sp. XZ_19_385]